MILLTKCPENNHYIKLGSIDKKVFRLANYVYCYSLTSLFAQKVKKLFIICFQGGGLASTNGLQRHIPRVSRAITKVINHVENLDQVTGYLEMLGKIHQQIGIEVITLEKFDKVVPYLKRLIK